MDEQKALLERLLSENPDLTMNEIRLKTGWSNGTFYNRLKEFGIEIHRNRGRKKGWRKPIKEG